MKKQGKYVRDKRSPDPLNDNVSKSMRGNKGRDTKPEILFRKLLWQNNLRGYRLHPKDVLGRPDICFKSKKIAVFINGCFWHRCPNCNPSIPKHNSEFWQNKFSRNVQRDFEKKRALENSGWKVVVVWECQIKQHNVDILLNNII